MDSFADVNAPTFISIGNSVHPLNMPFPPPQLAVAGSSTLLREVPQGTRSASAIALPVQQSLLQLSLASLKVHGQTDDGQTHTKADLVRDDSSPRNLTPATTYLHWCM